MSERDNEIGVEIVADPSQAEARLELFQRKVEESDRALREAGKQTAFGDDFARQTAQAQVGIEQAAKAAVEAGITIDRSFSRSAEVAGRSLDTVASAGRTSAQALREQELAARAAGEAAVTASATAAAAVEKKAQSEARATAEAKRLERGEDALYASLSKVNDKAGELTTSFHRLSGTPAGQQLADKIQRAEVRLGQARARAQELLRELERPSEERTITDIANKAAVAERRVARLIAELQTLEKEEQKRGGGRGSDAAPARPRSLSGTNDLGLSGQQREGIERISGLVGRVSGAGDIASTLSIARYGAGFAGLAVGGLAVTGLVAALRAARDLERAQLDLAVSSRDTGRSWTEAVGHADTFRASLIANREESLKVAAAYGELQLRTGETLRGGASSQLSTIATARGFTAEQTAQSIQGLARGSKEAFEQLTGTRADVALDRYAKSIGTTTARLTDMQRAQALTNAALARSADFTDLAERRAASFESRWASVKNTVSDFAGDFGEALVSRFALLENSEATLARKQRENEPSVAERRAEEAAAARRREEEALVARQQARRSEEEQFFDRFERSGRALPESYGAGLTQTERGQADLQRVRERRVALQREYEAFQQVRDQFSNDDATRFDTQFRDQIQTLSDQIRGALDTMVAEAQGKLLALRKDVRDSTAEFAALRLPADRNNPYVQFFSEAEYATERARERFGLLGEAAVQSFVKAQAAARDAARFELQVKDAMSAVRLEHEAAELARPFRELTGEMKRTLQVFEEEVAAARSVPGLLAQADLIDRSGLPGGHGSTGQPVVNQAYVQGQEFTRLQGLRTKYGNVEGLAGEQIRHRLDKELGELFKSLAPDARRDVLGRPELRDVFASAFRGQAQFLERQVGRAAERAEDQQSAVRLAERQLGEFNRLAGQPNADKTLLRKQFLEVTGSLPREELTGDLARGRRAALLEEAAHQRDNEARAKKAIEETAKFQKALIGENGTGGAIGALLHAVRARQETVIVEVLDRTDQAKVSTLGAGFG